MPCVKKEAHSETFEISYESIISSPELSIGPYLGLNIDESGRGMDNRIKSRLFDLFFKTEEGREETGLGLVVVYGIIKELKGAIRVESEKGRGASLYFSRGFKGCQSLMQLKSHPFLSAQK